MFGRKLLHAFDGQGKLVVFNDRLGRIWNLNSNLNNHLSINLCSGLHQRRETARHI